MVSQVFELFFQGERERHHPHDGLGIGLSLVKQLVELQGGTVSATSPGIGQGSEFTVRLPCPQAAITAGRGEMADATVPASPIT